MDIVFNPFVNTENQYIQLLVGELRAKGYRVHPLDTIFSSVKHFKSIRLVHLNWFENVDERGFFVGMRSFLRKLAVLAAIRLSGKPLVWTMHNRLSHERGSAFFSKIITRLLMRWSRGIVIHSRQSAEILAAYGPAVAQQAVYIPHPSFIGVYGDVVSSSPERTGALRLVFAGMVKPYKNLELLIDVVSGFGDKVQLTIAGKATDAAYEQQIRKQVAAAGNVTYLPYFIPDGELAETLGRADALVLPYDLSSSLNSGTVLLAFSYKRTVICPEIGTINDLGEQKANVFCYRYSGLDEHADALYDAISSAVAKHRENPDALRDMGNELYGHVAAVHDPQRVGDALEGLYKQLLEGRP